jgi:hypothetical protein
MTDELPVIGPFLVRRLADDGPEYLDADDGWTPFLEDALVIVSREVARLMVAGHEDTQEVVLLSEVQRTQTGTAPLPVAATQAATLIQGWIHGSPEGQQTPGQTAYPADRPALGDEATEGGGPSGVARPGRSRRARHSPPRGLPAGLAQRPPTGEEEGRGGRPEAPPTASPQDDAPLPPLCAVCGDELALQEGAGRPRRVTCSKRCADERKRRLAFDRVSAARRGGR